MDQYQHIMSVNSVLPFIIGYTLHGVLAAIQLGIALVMLLSSVVNLAKKNSFFWLSHLGFTNHLAHGKKQRFGAIQLFIAIVLGASLFLDLSFYVSLVAFLLAAVTYIYYQHQPHNTPIKLGSLSRYAIIAYLFTATVFTGYEHSSPLQAMKLIAQDIMTYRPLEQDWQDKHDLVAPKVGQQAVEFSLLQSDGKSTTELSDFLGKKPVVLFLGANSCPVFSAGLKDINRLHDKYKDRVNFVGVYVSEPHAIDEWPLARTRLLKNSKHISQHPVAIDIPQPTRFDQRQWAAHRLKLNLLNKDIPLFVDNMDNAVNNRWVGRPARLYIIGSDGKIVYNPGKGPYSFNPLYLESVLDTYLASDAKNLAASYPKERISL